MHISIKTQIQTNRRTNIYLDCGQLFKGENTEESSQEESESKEVDWPEDLVSKKMPVFYYPPCEDTMHEQIKSIEEPSQLWLTEMTRYYHGSSTYLEVQFWIKTLEGKMQLIHKCPQHPSIIKMGNQGDYEEKAVSHEEVKWHRNTMIFGVNFNCTRTCFKSEIYVFCRLRHGNVFMESQLIELPFRRSEKRKYHDNKKEGKKHVCTNSHTVSIAKPATLKVCNSQITDAKPIQIKPTPFPVMSFVREEAPVHHPDTSKALSDLIMQPPEKFSNLESEDESDMIYSDTVEIKTEEVLLVSSPMVHIEEMESDISTISSPQPTLEEVNLSELLNLEFWNAN